MTPSASWVSERGENMSRKIALIGAGMFTGLVAALFLILSSSNEVQANGVLEIPPTIAAVQDTSEQQSSEFEAALATREIALQEQLAQRQMAITTLDETYQTQFVVLEERLEETNSQQAEALERVEALRKEVERIQEEIATGDQAFQEEMTGLQNNLIYKDTQMRQEIEAVYGQLQQAYDQIAAQESLAMDNSGEDGSSSGSHDNNKGHDDSDHAGEHDDDHSDHNDGDEDHGENDD
jgi:hypothetical protein